MRQYECLNCLKFVTPVPTALGMVCPVCDFVLPEKTLPHIAPEPPRRAPVRRADAESIEKLIADMRDVVADAQEVKPRHLQAPSDNDGLI